MKIILFILYIGLFTLLFGVFGCLESPNNNEETAILNNQNKINLTNLTQTTESEICVEAFTSKTCPHCHQMKQLLSDLKKSYPQLKLIYYESGKYYPLRQRINAYYGVNPQYKNAVPYLVLNGKSYLGSSSENKQEITDIIKQLAKENKGAVCPSTKLNQSNK